MNVQTYGVRVMELSGVQPPDGLQQRSVLFDVEDDRRLCYHARVLVFENQATGRMCRLATRTAFGVSQPELHRHLGVEHLITYDRISRYELGRNEPPLMILLEYSSRERLRRGFD